VGPFQINVRSSSSRRQVCTHRSITGFIRGIWMPLSTTSIPASARTWSNRLGNFPSRSRSRIMNRARPPASSRSMTKFFAARVTQDAVGCVAVLRTLILRLACSITANTYSLAPDRVTVSKKSHASSASAWERRNAAPHAPH